MAVARLNPNGSLDGSFGSGGVAILDFNSYSVANGVVVQPDGKIVLVGSQRPGLQVTNGFVARLNPNGSLDPSFGGGGNPNVACSPGVCFYWHPAGGAYSSLNAVTLQNDGKIVAAGVDLRSQNDPGQPSCTTSDCPQAIVLRLSPGGAPDPTFGAGGIDGNGVAALPSGSQTNTGDPVGADGVGIGGGGAIIAAGDYQQQIGGEVALWAFTASGSPDSAFGSGGTVTTPLGGNAHGRALVVGSDGSLLVAGQAGTGGFLARYLGLGPPPVGGAPVVITGAPSAVSASAATVTGQVNPDGLATAFHVDYGLTATYGARTANGSAGAGRVPVGVSATLTGLSPATTYHYRLVGANSAGTVTGADRTFTTAAVPTGAPRVATGTARAGDVSAIVSGQVNPDGLRSAYHVEYGRSSAYGSSTSAVALPAGVSPVGVAARLTRLRPNTTYHYRFVAANADGTTHGADRTFKTARSLTTVLRGVASSYHVSAVIKNGLTLRVGCNQGCSIAASMLISKSAAKQLGLTARQLTIGGGSASLKRAGTARLRLRVRLGSVALRKLAAERALAVTLRIVSTPAGGGRTVTTSKSVTFGR